MACGGCSSDRSYTLQLIDKVQHNDTTVSFDFAGLEKFTWKEGDSSKLFVPIDGVMEGMKFSYVTLPEEKLVRFTTRIRHERSDYKEQMNQLTIGDLVEVSEPDGSFALQRDSRPALLLSNGVGIAAMRGLVKSFGKDQEGVNRLTQINVDNTGDLYKEEFEALAERLNSFKSIYVNHREEFYKQVDFESQTLMLTSGYVPLFYVVGSESFLLDVTAYLMSVGFDETDVVTDGQGCGSSCGCGSSGGCGCS